MESCRKGEILFRVIRKITGYLIQSVSPVHDFGISLYSVSAILR